MAAVTGNCLIRHLLRAASGTREALDVAFEDLDHLRGQRRWGLIDANEEVLCGGAAGDVAGVLALDGDLGSFARGELDVGGGEAGGGGDQSIDVDAVSVISLT